MTHRLRPVRFLFGLALLMLAAPAQLPAYIDPGSGSFLVQMLVAGVLGALVTVKTFWKQIKAYLSRGAAPPEE